MNELPRSRYLAGFAFLEHLGPDVARMRATATLESGEFDAVLMIDSDQGVIEPPGAPSWIDRIVDQYQAGEPRRILFAAVGIDHSKLEMNFRRREGDGRIAWAGSGLMFLPAVVWRELRAHHASPWTAEGPDEMTRGEDVILTSRAVALGVELEIIRNLTIAHWPAWRHPLVVQTGADGRPERLETHGF